jgi:subtilase family serine protease
VAAFGTTAPHGHPRPAARRRAVAAAVAVVAVAALAAMGVTGTAQASADRATVHGTRPGWATTAHRVGGAGAPGGSVHVRVYLAGRDPAGLAAAATAVSDPANPGYTRYLSAAQARLRFGATPAQIAAVSRWLSGGGMRVTAVTGHYVAATGTTVQAQQTFRVQFASYRTPSGQIARAPQQDATVPAAAAGSVLTITGLDTARPTMRPLDTLPLDTLPRDTLPPPGRNFYIAPPCSTYWAQLTATSAPEAYGSHQPYALCGYTPRQLRGGYGVTGTGLSGKGITIAIVDAYTAPTMLADADRYARVVGDQPFAPGQYREADATVFQHTALCNPAGWYGEQTLDVEAVHGMAPGAGILYVGGTDCTDEGLLDALSTIVDNHLADIVSSSWGETEDGTTAAAMTAYNQIFELGAVEGIGFNFSSGDCGYEDPANACGAGRDGSDKIQADWPATSPWVTAVGGTSLAIGRNDTYQFETGWGVYKDPAAPAGSGWAMPPPGAYPASYNSGAGGGTSTVFGQPSYQATVVPNDLSQRLPDGTFSPTPMREVPDISADADPQTGFLDGETVGLKDNTFGFALSRIGGTSLAAPLTAGLLADAMQAAHHAFGLANPLLYLLAHTPVFHDVTGSPLGRQVPVAVVRADYTTPSLARGPIVTSLRTTGLDGGGDALLRAAPGYDDVTGIGSPTLRMFPFFLIR